jgi:hypothetical protein
MNPDETRQDPRLAAMRDRARKCVDLQLLVIRPLAKANRDLDAAYRDAVAALAGVQEGK